MNFIKIKQKSAERFFLGASYPLLVAVITVAGYISGLEFYLNILSMLILYYGILATSSVLPLAPVITMYAFSISPRNSPEPHFASDYYHSPARIFIMALTLVIAIILALFVTAERGGFQSARPLPLARSVILLPLALLLGGSLSGEWEIENAIYALIIVALYFGIFYLFFFGFLGEEREKVVSYLIHTATAMALVLIIQTAHLYLTSDSLIVGGKIVKDEVLYGWGMWTMAGQFLAITIPPCFLGVMKMKRWWIYFIIATLALLSIVFTLSRNALLVGGAVYFISLLLSCFYSKHKKVLGISSLLLFLTLLLSLIIFSKEILTALSDYIERGFSNNGRFALWEHGIKKFLDSPLFGKGIFGLQREIDGGTPEGFTLYPRMMHNTVIQILGSLGIFGLFAYSVYRTESLVPFFKNPSVEKTLLLLTLLVLIIASLIDNFIFLPKHLIFYSITLAAAFRVAKK